MSEYQNRSIVLVRRPDGEVRDDDFRTDTEVVRDLQPGEFLIKILYLSLDPYMRPKMNDVESYMPPMELDAVVQGENIGRIVESRSEGFAVGGNPTSRRSRHRNQTHPHRRLVKSSPPRSAWMSRRCYF